MINTLMPLIIPVYTLVCLVFPEVNIALFVLIGKFNYEPRLAILEPFSLNHINLVIFMIHFYLLARERKIPWTSFSFMEPYLPFFAYLSINAILLSAYPQYALNKIGSLFLISTVSAWYIWLRQRTGSRLFSRRVVRLVILLAFGISVMGLLKIATGQAEMRLTVLGGGPIALARINGIAIIALAGCFFSTPSRRNRLIILSSGLLFFLSQIWTQSKGPILMLILILILALYLYPVRHRKRIIISLVSAAVILIIATNLFFDLEGRFMMNPLSDSPMNTYKIRWILFSSAWDSIVQAPVFGVGLGNYMDFGMVNGVLHKYPHNIFLEVFSETGVVGFILLSIILVAYLRLGVSELRNFVQTRDGFQTTIHLITLYLILNQMISGDLTSARYFWFFMLLSRMSSPEQIEPGQRTSSETV